MFRIHVTYFNGQDAVITTDYYDVATEMFDIFAEDKIVAEVTVSQKGKSGNYRHLSSVLKGSAASTTLPL